MKKTVESLLIKELFSKKMITIPEVQVQHVLLVEEENPHLPVFI